jgi:outer membrane lipoprotein carrier protein
MNLTLSLPRSWVPQIPVLGPGKARNSAYLGFFLLALASSFCSQPDSAVAPARTAHDVAQLVDHHYNQLHSLRADFTETYEGLGMQKSESGTLLLLKPGRMRWDYSAPASKLFLIDGKNAWFYVQGAAQVQRISAKQLDDLRSPLRFLLGHTELEKEMSGLHLAASSPGQGTYELVGQPKGQENRVRRVSLTVASGTGAIEAIEIEETDGALTHFIFAGQQPNAPVPEGAFHFTPPPGIPVVDSLPPV